MKTMSELGVQVPASISLMRRFVKNVSVEQREAALRQAGYNHFAFPADLLILDFLSDSGTSCMTDLQWASLILGDESYGRNRGLLHPAGRRARHIRARRPAAAS